MRFRRKSDGMLVLARQVRPSELTVRAAQLGLELQMGDWVVQAPGEGHMRVARADFGRDYEPAKGERP